MINDFGSGDRAELDAVVPSLLRHLCDAPGLLAILHVVLVPKFRDGTLAAAFARMKASMLREAERVAPYIGPLVSLLAGVWARRSFALAPNVGVNRRFEVTRGSGAYRRERLSG